MDLAEGIGKLHLRLSRALDQSMAREGVSFARYKLLRFVQTYQPTRSRDIADFFGFAPRTVTEAIDALERENLVVRTRDPQDRRAKPITLTAAGAAAIMASGGPLTTLVDHVYGSLDDDDRETLARLLKELISKLDARIS